MSLSALADNMNVYAPSALTYAGNWSATQNYLKNNVVVGSDGSAYVLQIASNTGTDPVGATPPSPWVALAGGGGGGGGGTLSFEPLVNTFASGVWSPTSAYEVGNIVRDNTATGFGQLYVCNTAVPEPPVLGNNVAPSDPASTPSPWSTFSVYAPLTQYGSGLNLASDPADGKVKYNVALTAGAGITLTPSIANNSIEIASAGAGTGLKLIGTGTALTPLVAGGVAVGNVITVPLQSFNLGLTPGQTYLITMMFDGGANTTWTASSGGSTLTSSPFLSNSASGLEDSLPSLFGYGQQDTFTAPTGTSAVSNGANPLIDFSPITYTVFYPALDTNVYINVRLSGGASGTPVSGISWTDYLPGWSVWLSAVNLGAT